MNKMIALGLFAMVATSNALAAPLKLECGRSFNVPRTVVITEKKSGNDGYSHAATYKTSGADQTTGMLKAVTYKMVGHMDLSTEFTGEVVPVLVLYEKGNPLFQLVIRKPTADKMAPIPGVQIDLKTESVKKFNCLVK